MNPTAATLVVDVGGTNTRMALAAVEGHATQLLHLQVLPTPKGRLTETLQSYLAPLHHITVMGIAVAAAGRIRRLPGRISVSLTNAALTVEREELQTAFNLSRVWLVNDLAAIAAALPCLAGDELRAMGNARTAMPGHRLVVGLGTGFGVAALTADGTLIETEAGHANLAAVSASERQWLNSLAPLGRVAIEQVLSGPGLLRLHAIVARQPLENHEELHLRWARGDAGALRTYTAFSTWLGRVVSDLVLCHGAWSGVVLAGGVVEKLGAALDAEAFRSGFEDKAPFSADLGTVPVWTVHHPQPALLGLARLAQV